MTTFSIHRVSKRNQYLYSIGSVLAAGVVGFSVSEFVSYRVVAFLLLLTVSILAVSFDILPVLLAAVLSALMWDVFFIPPRFTIHVDNTEDAILLLMYFVIAMVNGVLTYRIRQIEKISRLKEERANSVQLYNTILSSLSHELRTPIAAIIAATDNLQYNQNISATARDQLINEISKAGIRLNQQVENLLNISRLESGHIQPKKDWCDIVELVYATVRNVEENNAGRKINISINQDLPLCSLDKGMLEQVVYNLLNNAALHTAPHGKIEIGVLCHTDLLELMIDDSGGGISVSELRTVFQKFTRGNVMATGRPGLGLSIVRGFTEALGGNVEISPSRLGGASFTITIPVRTNYFVPDNE